MFGETGKTIQIEGMMCPHCEAHVEKALSALPGVTVKKVSHKKGTAVVRGDALDDAALTQAVEAAGYKVLGIQ